MRGGQLTWYQRGTLWFRLGIRMILTLLALWLLVHFGPPALSLFAPFIVAMIAAALLNPLIRWFQRKIGWSRHLLTLLLIIGLLGTVGGLLALLVYSAGNELISLVRDWDVLLDKLLESADALEALFAQLPELIPPSIMNSLEDGFDGLMEWLSKVVPAALGSLASSAGHKAMGVPSVVVAFIISITATYFLASDYPYLRSNLLRHMDEGLVRFTQQVRVTVLGAFGGYLKAQVILSVGVFFILLIGFFAIHQPYCVLLAFLFSLMDFIPLIGAGTIMVPWAVIALFTRDFLTAVQLMVIWGIIVLYRRVMEPKIVGDQTGLSPILSLVSIYVGMRLGGVLGMIFGPILTLVVLNLTSMGLFHGVRLDLEAAAQDIAAILSQHPEDTPPHAQ